MKYPLLTAEARSVIGKKVKKLRREGLLPANVYGKDVTSTALQVKVDEFISVFKEVGETGLVDLKVDGQSKPVLIKNIHMDYRTLTPLHADFYQVNLKEKVKTMVPLVTVGEAYAVTEKLGLLLQPLAEVEVEALPESLPEHIEVPIAQLAAIDDQIMVSDLQVPKDVTILSDPGQVVVKIAELVVEEPEPEEIPEEEAAEGAEGTQAEKDASADESAKEPGEEKTEEEQR